MAAAPSQQFFSMESYKRSTLKVEFPGEKTNEFPSPFSKLWSREFVLRGVVLGQEKVAGAGAAQKGISVDTW